MCYKYKNIEVAMRNKQTNTRKKLISIMLCSLFVLQQSLVYPVLASEILDGKGNPIDKFSTGNFEIRPDLFNDKVGFKEFQKLNLSEGDVLNFIFQAYNFKWQEGGTGNSDTMWHDVDTFVNFVNSQINIQGIVNALATVNGELKQNGNLVFVSPEGMVVGASGVLNVGNLSVFTPSTDAYNTLKAGMKTVDTNDFGTQMGEPTDKTWNPNDSALYTGGAPIQIDGKIFARGDVELSGGQIAVGNTGTLIAGLGGDAESTVLANADAAEVLFNQLVSTDNMTIGNAFANSNGEIKITSSQGTSVAEGGAIRNFATNNSTTTITNNGTGGININGEVSNPNGTMTITNNAGALNVGTSGELKNKGDMTVVGQNSSTGVTINGTATNDGDMVIKNASGSNGLKIGGKVTNNTGSAQILNNNGVLQVVSGGSVTSNGTSLLMDNTGSGGLIVDGTVTSKGDTDILNHNNALKINGTVTSNGSTLNIENEGVNGLTIAGNVNNNSGIAEIINKAASTSGGARNLYG